MALASFFDKTALSAATLLRGFDRSAFEQKLEGTNIGICFDNNPAANSEQRVALELLVNLLARLYPTLTLICAVPGELFDQMSALALSINPQIEVRTQCAGLSVVIATVDSPFLDPVRSQCPIIYLGADGWTAKVSSSAALSWGQSPNSLGAAAAACLGAGNAFRHIFRDQLANPQLDENLALSLFDYSTNPVPGSPASIGPVDLSGTTLIGAGAIGNAAIWILRRLPELRGRLKVVDYEAVELSNLQRYVLAQHDSINVLKTNLVERAMEGGSFTVEAFPQRWADYLESSDWNLPRLAVAVDTIQERIHISGSLARETVNAWTQADEVGVSRHYNYGEEACLSCLYFPDGQLPSEADLVAQAVGLPNEIMLVRDLLQTGKPVDRPFLERAAVALGIPVAEILAFGGKPLRQFYSQAICGGMVFRLGATPAAGTEVPMAFQSALAGIFLAAEVIIAAGRLRSPPIANTTRLRVLEPVSENLLTPVAIVERCVCQDADFRSVYNRKYGASVPFTYNSESDPLSAGL